MNISALALSACLATTTAVASDWRSTWDGTLYGYANRTALREDSVLNPGNRVAGLAQHSTVTELRLNIKAENETVRLTARPIFSARETHNAFDSQQHNTAYFSQWQVRVRATEGWNVAAGREVLNWGPAQFRSPSSPFYFDNGRSDPMRELIGMDALKLSWTPDMQNSAALARIAGTGHNTAQPDAWRDSWLAKFDRRGDDWAYGLVAAKAPQQTAFYGAHGQTTLSDALLLYGEIGSGTLPSVLQPSADATQPFALPSPTPRRTATLAGASYAFEDGKSFVAEYLHEGHGYTPAEEIAYFQGATAAPAMALGLAPRLLGRDYLHLVWQSNLMDEKGYWRLMFTRNLGDGGNEFAAYAETMLNSKLSAYLMAMLPRGNARQEFSALLQRTMTLGLKLALP